VIAEFNTRLAQETEGKRLDPAKILGGVQALLGDSQHGCYFLAEAEGRVIGQIMHTREWSDWRNGEFWWLQSVYVRQDYRQRGVFRALMEFVFELAKQTPGVIGLRLYMEQENMAARRTYERCGFADEGYVVLERLLSEEHRPAKE
jgi:GNAT superfamily N-acetyltransferase